MASEGIKAIYKKLVQMYVEDFPRGRPLWILNKHINAYAQQWKSKEPAIIDLALRKGITIPEVKDLLEKGRTRKEAILEVSSNLEFRASEKEVEKWLKELSKEKPIEIKKVAKQKMEQQIEDHEKAIERLTVLFSKGEISEESYVEAIKVLEEKMSKCPHCGKRVPKGFKLCPYCGRKSKTLENEAVLFSREPVKSFKREGWEPPVFKRQLKPSAWWYLVPLLFGIFGGIVAYVGVKDEDKDMAEVLLVFGIVMFFIHLLIGIMYYQWLLR